MSYRPPSKPQKKAKSTKLGEKLSKIQITSQSIVLQEKIEELKKIAEIIQGFGNENYQISVNGSADFEKKKRNTQFVTEVLWGAIPKKYQDEVDILLKSKLGVSLSELRQHKTTIDKDKLENFMSTLRTFDTDQELKKLLEYREKLIKLQRDQPMHQADSTSQKIKQIGVEIDFLNSEISFEQSIKLLLGDDLYAFLEAGHARQKSDDTGQPVSQRFQMCIDTLSAFEKRMGVLGKTAQKTSDLEKVMFNAIRFISSIGNIEKAIPLAEQTLKILNSDDIDVPFDVKEMQFTTTKDIIEAFQEALYITIENCPNPYVKSSLLAALPPAPSDVKEREREHYGPESSKPKAADANKIKASNELENPKESSPKTWFSQLESFLGVPIGTKSSKSDSPKGSDKTSPRKPYKPQ